MITEIHTHHPIDIDNFPEEIEAIEDATDKEMMRLGYKVYRLKTYELNTESKTVKCVWVVYMMRF